MPRDPFPGGRGCPCHHAYDPQVGRGALWGAGLLFVAAIGLTSALLWTAHLQSAGVLWGGAAAVLACLVLAGRLCSAAPDAAPDAAVKGA